MVHGRPEIVRLLEVTLDDPLRDVVQRLCNVESTGRLVLVSETDFGAIVPNKKSCGLESCRAFI